MHLSWFFKRCQSTGLRDQEERKISLNRDVFLEYSKLHQQEEQKYT